MTKHRIPATIEVDAPTHADATNRAKDFVQDVREGEHGTDVALTLSRPETTDA